MSTKKILSLICAALWFVQALLHFLLLMGGSLGSFRFWR